MRSFYRYLQVHHGVANAVARSARMPRLDKRLPTHLRREEMDALFTHAEAKAAEGAPPADDDGKQAAAG